MKRLLFLLFLSSAAFGQSTAGPFVISSASSPCASISVTAQSSVGIAVTGTFSATLQPGVSIQGQAKTNIQVTPSTSSTAQATITAIGNYTASVGGYDKFYVCITAYTSGTATIWLNSVKTTAANGGTGGGGGGGGGSGFDAITSGTNTTAAMVLGSGSSLATSGTGIIKLANGDANDPVLCFTSLCSSGWYYDPIGGTAYWTDGSGIGGPVWGYQVSTTVGAGEPSLFVAQGGFFGVGLDQTGIGSATCLACFRGNAGGLTAETGASTVIPLTASVLTATTSATSPLYATTTNCSATGSAANPSLVACTAAPSGAFSCATNASATTCIISTTAAHTNSNITVTETASAGTRLGVTCNTAPSVVPAVPILSISNGVSFTINMPTIAVNPACFMYNIVN